MMTRDNGTREDTILEEAQRLVYSERNAEYGHPYDDYERVGAMWGAMLKNWASSGEAAIPPELACLMMCAVKISREVNRPKRDNRVDLAGYAACVDRIERRKAGEE